MSTDLGTSSRVNTDLGTSSRVNTDTTKLKITVNNVISDEQGLTVIFLCEYDGNTAFLQSKAVSTKPVNNAVRRAFMTTKNDIKEWIKGIRSDKVGDKSKWDNLNGSVFDFDPQEFDTE